MKRTLAAFTILVGLTALMVGFYTNELSTITQVLHGYVILLP